MATLEEFLTTGRLGSISLGATKDCVRRALGEPEDVSLQKNPAVWKYGALQLAFYKSKSDLQPSLELIGIYFHTPEEQLPERLALAGWVPTGETTVSEFLNWLKAQQIAVPNSVASERAGRLVIADSGVQVHFSEGKVQSIQLSGSVPRKSAGQQVSVMLPDNVLERLRQEAAERKVSISALCARWITEHVGSSPD